jgi:predicted Zn-dependent peptidase
VLTIIKEVLLTLFLTLPNLKEKKQVIGWAGAKESPQSVIGAYFESILYGDHVYGNVVTGNQSTVSKLTVNDLGSFTK